MRDPSAIPARLGDVVVLHVEVGLVNTVGDDEQFLSFGARPRKPDRPALARVPTGFVELCRRAEDQQKDLGVPRLWRASRHAAPSKPGRHACDRAGQRTNAGRDREGCGRAPVSGRRLRSRRPTRPRSHIAVTRTRFWNHKDATRPRAGDHDTYRAGRPAPEPVGRSESHCPGPAVSESVGVTTGARRRRNAPTWRLISS